MRCAVLVKKDAVCERFYADDGRPALPRRYFRLQLIGYFEGLDAERAIERVLRIRLRCASSSGWCCRRRRPMIRRFRERVG